MTLRKLASLAGVSVSTVSKAFSDSGEISNETKQRIFAVARREGCFEKYYKGKYQKDIIAVICPEICSEYYSQILTCLEKEINAMGAVMVVSISHFDRTREKQLFEYHSFLQKTDGVIVIGDGCGIINTSYIPAVAVGNTQRLKNIDSVGIDVKKALKQAVAYLKKNGHRKIGFAGEMRTAFKCQEFICAMEESGLTAERDWIYISEERFEAAGRDCAQMILNCKERPTALIAAYDYIALGIIQQLRESSLRVPEDFSLIGMDDISAASYTGVELTSIRTPVEDLCRVVLKLLKRKMKNPYACCTNVIQVSSELIVRNTVKKREMENF